MTRLFLVPKTGRVKPDVVRPLTLDEGLRLLEKKFSKPRDPKAKPAPKVSRNGWDNVIFPDFTPAEVIDFDDDPKDAA